MGKLAALLLILTLTGCGSQNYYESIRESNESIAIENSAIAEACADALESVKGDAGATVAVALTVCQGKMKLIIPVAPEKPSQIIGSLGRAVLLGSAPWAIIDIVKSGRATDYNIGGDMISTTNSGPGSAATNRTYPVEVIMQPAE